MCYHEQLKVIGAYNAGLVSKKKKPWARDSVDFISVIEDFSSIPAQVSLWGVEVKTRCTLNTSNAEADFVYDSDRGKMYQSVMKM